MSEIESVPAGDESEDKKKEKLEKDAKKRKKDEKKVKEKPYLSGIFHQEAVSGFRFHGGQFSVWPPSKF